MQRGLFFLQQRSNFVIAIVSEKATTLKTIRSGLPHLRPLQFWMTQYVLCLTALDSLLTTRSLSLSLATQLSIYQTALSLPLLLSSLSLVTELSKLPIFRYRNLFQLLLQLSKLLVFPCY